MDFITDRNQNDVDRWKELRDKGFDRMTPEERSEWLGNMKGCYGHNDMNRVERAVEALSARLSKMGYLYYPIVKTDWTVQDAPNKKDFERYLGNVAGIRKLLKVYTGTPVAPTVGERLNWSRANDIEKILKDVECLAESITQSNCYAGEIFIGEA